MKRFLYFPPPQTENEAFNYKKVVATEGLNLFLDQHFYQQNVVAVTAEAAVIFIVVVVVAVVEEDLVV